MLALGIELRSSAHTLNLWAIPPAPVDWVLIEAADTACGLVLDIIYGTSWASSYLGKNPVGTGDHPHQVSREWKIAVLTATTY